MAKQDTNSQNRGNLVADLIQNVQLAWQLMQDPRVSRVSKVLVPLLGLAYLVIPVDLLPDVVPVLGQLDDVAVLLVLLRVFIAMAPADVVDSLRRGAGGATAGSASPPGSQPNTGSTSSPRGDVVDADYRILDDD